MQHPTLLIITTNNDYDEHIKPMALELLASTNYSNHPDYFEIDETSSTSIGIEAVKKFEKQIQLKPFQSQNKLYIIKNSHQLTVQAQNALLKTLEEPPLFTQIVLFATNKTSFLPTILSRCVIYEFNNVKIDNELLYQQANDFLNMDITQRFLFIDEISKTSPIVERNRKIIGLFEALGRVLREERLKDLSEQSKTTYKNKLNEIDKAARRLKANTNFKLTLENLAIRL